MMRRRYDLGRSDNYMYTGRVTHTCYGTGNLAVYTGFPVTSAIVSWATLSILAQEVSTSSSSQIENWSSSSTSSSYKENWSSSSYSSSSSMSSLSHSSSSINSLSSSSSTSSKSSSSSSMYSASSLSTNSSSSSSSVSSSSSSSSSYIENWSSSSHSSSSSSAIIEGLPVIYVSGYSSTGFIITYENIPPQIGFIDFTFAAV